MKDQQINAAIAELCGWKCAATNKHESLMCWVRPGNSDWQLEQLPDYCNDLNAMHKAIMDFDNETIAYIDRRLTILFGPEENYVLHKIINATARQRAEAFLRALGKWVEE